MAESAAKRLKPTLTIGTHSGHFHADEALAVHMLRMLPAYRDAALVRTRDADVLAGLHTVVDVGGEYDAARNRFDHHQRGFATTFPGRQTKLSSAGLVFLHFGRAIIAQRLNQSNEGEAGNQSTGAAEVKQAEEVKEDDAVVSLLHNKLYETFIEALDAHDNGIAAYDPAALAAAGIEKRFSQGGFGLGALVGRLNPRWNEPKIADPAAAQRAEDARFEEASRRIGEEFERDLNGLALGWLPARSIVERAFGERREHDAQGRLLVLKGQSVPWKDHLFSLEGEAEAEAEAEGEGKAEAGNNKVLYVLYAESEREGAKWRVQCVPESGDSFTSRRPLPEVWRGFRDGELDKISGVEGCVFVHAAGFIGGNKTFEGAMEMARKALE